MRAFISIKYHPDNRNRPTIERISDALEQHGYETVCVIRDLEAWGEVKFSAQELMRRTFSAIETSDLVVIDETEKGVGLGIEAGYACARGIPMITILCSGSDLSATLQGISGQVGWYANLEEIPQTLSGMLSGA